MISSHTVDEGKNLPTVQQILALLRQHSKVLIKYSTSDPAYVDNLMDQLSDFYVAHIAWDNTISITAGISNGEILKLKDEIYECARSFRQDAILLMQLMSDKFSIDLETLDGLHELKFKKSNKQRGKLTDEWNYYLHGAECQFENTRTKQIVEIIIITRPEFGCLDGYFFYNYMTTTDKFKSLAHSLDNDYINVCKAIDLLTKEGILTRMPHLNVDRNIIAL